MLDGALNPKDDCFSVRQVALNTHFSEVFKMRVLLVVVSPH